MSISCWEGMVLGIGVAHFFILIQGVGDTHFGSTHLVELTRFMCGCVGVSGNVRVCRITSVGFIWNWGFEEC